MKKIGLLFALCLLGISYANCQIVKRNFTATFFVNDSTVRDTTLNVCYFFDDGKISEVHIDCINNDTDVRSAYFFCASKNVAHYSFLRQALISAKEKFEEWSEIARTNKVSNYTKPFDVDKKYLSFFISFNHKEKGNFTNMYGGIDVPPSELVPTFVVSSSGICHVAFGVLSTNAFRYKKVEGHTPSLWSRILTEKFDGDKESLRFHQALLRFHNKENLQSLIDALDGEKAQLEYEKLVKEKNKRDEMFK